jgi:GDP-L-fucose synthase
MKVLVTGASGFLGTHLCRELVNRGDEVTTLSSKDGDLTQQGSLSSLNDVKFDLIFHLAAWTQAGDFCLHHPGEQWIKNQQINTNVLTWWHEAQPDAKMIAIGTSCCYEPGTPHVESRFMTGDPTESLYTYAMTKRMLFAGLRALHAQFGHRYLFLVPSTLYGPDYHLDGRQMHFIFDLMRKIVDGKHKGSPVILWGDGSQSRELIHITDFVKSSLKLTDTVNNDIVNIGGGVEYPIRWYAEELSALIGFDKSRIEYDASKYVGARSKVLDITKLRRLLPEFSPTPLREGLRSITDWYIRQLNL